MKNEPKVSVIIPSFNREHLIQKSIISVLTQTYRKLELIIVDDSTDNTETKVKEIKDERLIYIKNKERVGPSKARNMGIEISSGELIAFQDSDDEWYNDKLEKQVNLLTNASDDVAGVYCGQEFFDFQSGSKIGEDLLQHDFQKDFVSGSYIPHTPPTQTILIKKNALSEVGLFDERLYAAEDTELVLRVSKKYGFLYIKEPLIKVTRNHDQLTANARNYTLAKEIIYEKHKDYLSQKILWGLCKQIANYYILKAEFDKAKHYIKKSFKHKFDIITLVQYSSIIIAPFLVKYAYSKKYKDGIPNPTNLPTLNSEDFQS